VRAILQEKGIWEYFVFPSVDWTPKARRLEAIIEAVQLRPASVLFIDDNPMNRREAKALMPDLQVVDEKFIEKILENPRFRGKDDRKLSRLSQYKLLERRRTDMLVAGQDNTEFLRASDIRVVIDPDIEANIDRAVELINRTNQLNFTKCRLPEDLEAARTKLLEDISPHDCKAGLIRVLDRYGDYGNCGFYLVKGYREFGLRHYCFSCRILGMGVEKWLFDKLGRPSINVRGEVLTDLFDGQRIDWINVVDSPAESQASPILAPEIRLRGGCDLQAVTHYLKKNTERVVEETNFSRDGLFIRADSTSNLLLAQTRPQQDFIDEIAKAGLLPEDVSSDFLNAGPAGTALIFSPWCDAYGPTYRHKKLGFRMTFNIPQCNDLTKITDEHLEARLDAFKIDQSLRPRLREITRYLRENYEFTNGIDEQTVKDNMRRIFERVPPGTRMIVILPYDYFKEGGVLVKQSKIVQYKVWVREIAKAYPAIDLVEMDGNVNSETEVEEGEAHFHRMVYFRLYKKIAQRLSPAVVADANRLPVYKPQARFALPTEPSIFLLLDEPIASAEEEIK
jgi:FkbH-like protein